MSKNLFITVSLLASATAIALASQSPSGADTSIDEAQVQKIVSAYIQENPQAILDSVTKHQAGQQERDKKDQRQLVRDNHDAIYDAEHSPRFGDEDAVVTLVEFYDYNCPACKMMFKTLEQVLAEKPGKLRIIFKEMPIFGPQSNDNAKVAFAVNELAPEKFFAWHKLMMDNKGRADLAFALAAAAEVGLNQQEVSKAMNKPEFEGYINTDRELAQLLNIRGTPAVIVGDVVVNSAMGKEDLLTLMETFEQARDQAIEEATGGVVKNHAE